MDSFAGRRTNLGELEIVRFLPRRQRRMVGAWCFLDRYGPLSFGSDKAMDVAPHPHIGLQTVSWLVEGEIVHNDSLGFEAVIRPGQLNLMTAGAGIAHAEETPRKNSGKLSGVQLWVALPNETRNRAAAFNHYGSLPVIEFREGTATLMLGELAGHRSPAPAFSAIVGAEVLLQTGAAFTVPLNPGFEHAVLVLTGAVMLDGRPLQQDMLHYLGAGRQEVSITGSRHARMLLIGGVPFPEPIVMWWNFVARTHEEIAAARQDWIDHKRFDDVKGYAGPRLEAPDLMRTAPAEPAS